MTLIALTGKKQSGKNTVASIISKLVQPRKVHELAFADPLKDEVCKAMNITRSYLEAHKSNFRLILQGWGTDYRRQLCDDRYWLSKFMLRLSGIDNASNPMVIVTDVRFKNEAELIRNINGIIIGIQKVDRTNSSIDDSHSSETELHNIKCDEIIYNNGTFEQLKQQVAKMLIKMKEIK